jgi:hypothetical protein
MLAAPLLLVMPQFSAGGCHRESRAFQRDEAIPSEREDCFTSFAMTAGNCGLTASQFSLLLFIIILCTFDFNISFSKIGRKQKFIKKSQREPQPSGRTRKAF